MKTSSKLLDLKKEYEERFNIKIDEKKKKKSSPDANILLGTEEGYEAFREKHLDK